MLLLFSRAQRQHLRGPSDEPRHRCDLLHKHHRILCTLQINQKISFKLTHLSNEPTVGGNGNFRQALERCTYTLKQCFWAKLGPYSIVMCQLSCGKDSLYQQLLHRQPTQLIIFLIVSPLQFLTASTTNRSTTTTTTSSLLPFIAYRYYMPAGWLLF